VKREAESPEAAEGARENGAAGARCYGEGCWGGRTKRLPVSRGACGLHGAPWPSAAGKSGWVGSLDSWHSPECGDSGHRDHDGPEHARNERPPREAGAFGAGIGSNLVGVDWDEIRGVSRVGPTRKRGLERRLAREGVARGRRGPSRAGMRRQSEIRGPLAGPSCSAVRFVSWCPVSLHRRSQRPTTRP
jgi:hypothetical protein